MKEKARDAAQATNLLMQGSTSLAVAVSGWAMDKMLPLAAVLLALTTLSACTPEPNHATNGGSLDELSLALAAQHRRMSDSRVEPGDATQWWAGAPRTLLDTGLLDLAMYTVDLVAMNAEYTPNRTAMGILGRRIMLADVKGRFFEIDMGNDKPQMRTLPFNIETNITGIQEYFRDTGSFGISSVNFHDIEFIGDDRAAVSYSHWDHGSQCVTLRVDLLRLNPDWSLVEEGRKEIFRSEPCLPINSDYPNFAGHQAGGRMIAMDERSLILTVGDFAKDLHPQNLSADYGKIFRISLECCEKEIISYGHRNTQGLTYDAEGQLWTAEHGPRGGDELNLVKPGRDYGWPTVTLGVDYSVKAYGDHPVAGRHEQFEKPRYAWLPSIAVSHLFLSTGFAPEWEGAIIASTLKDQSIHRLYMVGDRVIYDEPIEVGHRLRDAGQLIDGTMVFIADDAKLLVVPVPEFPDAFAFVNDLVAGMGDSARSAFQACRECHSVSPGGGDTAESINLANVWGRDIGSITDYPYSEALRSIDGVWDPPTLDAFIADPHEFAAGTTMAFEGLSDANARRELLALLQHLKERGDAYVAAVAE